MAPTCLFLLRRLLSCIDLLCLSVAGADEVDAPAFLGQLPLLLPRIDLLHRPVAVADDVDALGRSGCIDPLACLFFTISVTDFIELDVVAIDYNTEDTGTFGASVVERHFVLSTA